METMETESPGYLVVDESLTVSCVPLVFIFLSLFLYFYLCPVIPCVFQRQVKRLFFSCRYFLLFFFLLLLVLCLGYIDSVTRTNRKEREREKKKKNLADSYSTQARMTVIDDLLKCT